MLRRRTSRVCLTVRDTVLSPRTASRRVRYRCLDGLMSAAQHKQGFHDMRPVRIAALAVALSVLAAAPALAAQSPGTASPSSAVHLMLTRQLQAQADAAAAAAVGGAAPGGTSSKLRPNSTGISYHGGPIVVAEKVAAVYWASGTIYNGGPAAGTKGSGSSDGSLVGAFLRSLGGSNYYNINTTYYNGSGTHVSGTLSYSAYWADSNNAPTSGQSVSDSAVQSEIVAGFTNGSLAYDASTVYAVFSANGVNLGGNAFSQYCAYHGDFSWNGNVVLYAVMPYDWTNPSACAVQTTTPNGDPAADTEVNTLAHELEEANTDPQLNAWYDNRGYENADKCAWTFGTTYTTSNGALANMSLGGKNYLVQRNWKNSGSGGCYLQ